MSNIYICSDLHYLHSNIDYYRWCREKGISTCNDYYIKNEIDKHLKPKDTFIVLGDVDFSKDGLGLRWLHNIVCKKILVKGNHDNLPIEKYLEVFDNIHGLWFKYGFQFSHAPVHPDFLRGKINIHGHTHCSNVKRRKWFIKQDDPRYFNVCPENLIRLNKIGKVKSNVLLSLEELRCLIKPKV